MSDIDPTLHPDFDPETHQGTTMGDALVAQDLHNDSPAGEPGNTYDVVEEVREKADHPDGCPCAVCKGRA